MTDRFRHAIAPVYLFACLILGGSAQGIWANMVLQLGGLGLLAWAALEPGGEALGRPARRLLILVMIAAVVVALQLVPLPPSIWPHVGGREGLATDYRLLGIGVPALPLTLTPYDTLDTFLKLIPPLALFCAMVRLHAYRPMLLAIGLVAGTIAGILLGAAQVASSAGGQSAWYVYAESNFGVATGFFANANHMATLLVISLPFLAALLQSARGATRQRKLAVLAIVLVTGLVIVVGIALNGSLAGYGLALPVLVASAVLLLPQRSRLRVPGLIAAAFLLVAAVAFISTNAIHARNPQESTSVETRQAMLKTSAKAVADFMPLGSGLGSFESVYRLYEDPGQVTNEYVIHAHDDYVELALEMGLPGIILMIAFLAWWAVAAWRAWSSLDTGPYGRAASIASAAILVHSLVDFPLRTAAISAAFAMCLALMAERSRPVARTRSDLRPTRHLVFR